MAPPSISRPPQYVPGDSLLLAVIVVGVVLLHMSPACGSGLTASGSSNVGQSVSASGEKLPGPLSLPPAVQMRLAERTALFFDFNPLWLFKFQFTAQSWPVTRASFSSDMAPAS